MDGERIYQRIEKLERQNERTLAIIDEYRRRLDLLEGGQGEVRAMLHEIASALARLETRLESVKTWQGIVWPVVFLILGGIVGAGFELFKR